MIASFNHLLGFLPRRTQRHVFICGCGHSGTTLLAKMLGAHRGIFTIPYETEAFLHDNTFDHIKVLIAHNFYDAAHAKRAQIICEKTPRHIWHLEEIRQCFPNCRFIFPVRDARDVALSIKLRAGSLLNGYERWYKENTVVKEQIELKHQDVFFYKYEDFIEDIEGVLRLICRHINLRFDPSMLLYVNDERHWFQIDQARIAYKEPSPRIDHESFRDWQVRQPIMSDRRNRWRSMLDSDEVAQIETRCGNLMSYFGYQPS